MNEFIRSAFGVPPLALLVMVVTAFVLDAIARRTSLYSDLDLHWPAGWRPTSAARSANAAPYREMQHAAWTSVPAGLPRLVTAGISPALLLSVTWTFCILLALRDFREVFAGTRDAGQALGSLLLILARACAGWSLLGFVYMQARRSFAVSAAAVLGLDVALSLFALPCSDTRIDDVHVANVGLLIHAPMVVGYGWTLRRRRGFSLLPVVAPLTN